MPPFAEFDAGLIIGGLALAAALGWWLAGRADDAIEPHDDWDEFEPGLGSDAPEDVTRRSQV